MAAAYEGNFRTDSAGTLVQRYQQRVRIDLLENASKAAARPTGWRAVFAERAEIWFTTTPVLRAFVVVLKLLARQQLVATGLLLPFAAVFCAFMLTLWPPVGSRELGLAALAAIVMLGVTQPIRGAALGATIIVGGCQVLGALLSSPSASLPDLSVAIALLFTGLLAHRHGMARLHEQGIQKQAKRAVDKLEPVDSVAGVLKWTHASLVFDRELARAHRYEQPLSLLRVVIDQWEAVQTHLGPRKSDKAIAEVGARLIAGSRIVDIVAYHGDATFDLLLPDTGDLGAVVVARRVADHVSEFPGVRLRIGVVPLAGQAGNIDHLLHCGDIAIRIAEQTHRPFAIFGVATVPPQQTSDWTTSMTTDREARAQ
jgi:diguanylate cyclase (GGDEF)-like protein